MVKKRKKEKHGAIELSMSTIVVLVLAMVMLIMGLVLVRSIFTGATESVNELNEKVKGEITTLFSDEDSQLVVKLGSDRTARIKANTDEFGIGIGAKTLDGSTVDSKTMRYTLSLDESTNDNCYKELGRKGAESLFKQMMDVGLEFDRYEGDTAFAIVQVTIPKGTPLCSQKVYVDVKDGSEPIGREMFIVKITRSGLF